MAPAGEWQKMRSEYNLLLTSAVLAASAAWIYWTGELNIGRGTPVFVFSREDTPIRFWLAVSCMIGLSLYLAADAIIELVRA